MTLFLIILSSLLIGTVVTLSLILRRKNIEVSELNETIKMVRESKERRKQQSLDAINKLYDADRRLAIYEAKVDDIINTYNQMLKCYQEEKEVYEKREDEVILKDAELSALKQKMETAYVVHQVIIYNQEKGEKVLCLAEVIHSENMSKAFNEFRIKRNKRLKDNKINPVNCGHFQIHRVFPDTK